MPSESFEVIDQEQPKNGKIESTLTVGSIEHEDFLIWLEENKEGWKPTHNTHAGLVIIHQAGFRLLLYRNNDSAVVITTDQNGKKRYYKKDLEVGALPFLD